MTARRAIQIDTAPPPDTMLRMLPQDDPYAMVEIVGGGTVSRPDWCKLETYFPKQHHIICTDHFLASRKQMYVQNLTLLSNSQHQQVAQSWVEFHNFCRHANAPIILLSGETNKTVLPGLVALTYDALSAASTDLLSYARNSLLEKLQDPLLGYEQYQKANWDQFEAEPITAETLAYARRLMRIMPTSLGAPDVAPAADGSITLEWVPEDMTHKLDKLFLDIGPDEEWRAYWKMRNGKFDRIGGHGLDDGTKLILKNLFDKLSA